MSHSISSRPSVRKGAAALSAGLFGLIGAHGALAQAPQPESYTWSAELVVFDKAANTVTARSRTVEDSAAESAKALRAGDEAMLTWSGINTAAGIRAIERGQESTFDRMTLPIEFVSTDADGRYVVFKVQIPAADAAAIEPLEEGQWVTATSPHRPDDAADAVSSIRPYNTTS